MIRFLLPLVILFSTPASAATLQVTVTNVRNSHGRVLVAVCSRRDFLKPHCAFGRGVPAQKGDVTVSLSVPVGIWAVQAFQDENGDGKINRNFLGLPTEGIGFSRNAPFRFGPPDFSDAALQIGNQPSTIILRLRYF
jgi:uncharacterized protein (DUF2141 family)